MAWTDVTNDPPNTWTFPSPFLDAIGVKVSTDIPVEGVGVAVSSQTGIGNVYSVEDLSVPGFEDGYAPCSTPDSIRNNISEGCDGGGGGGSTRPTSGMLYPRGTG